MANVSYQDEPDKGLLRGQLFISTRIISKFTGISETTVRRFLNRCDKIKDIKWEKSCGGRPPVGADNGADNGAVSGAVFSRVTLLNFETYFPVKGKGGAVVGAVVAADNGAAIIIRKKKKEVLPTVNTAGDSEKENLTESSRIFNRYVEIKRETHERPEWQPTAAQAIQMRANIKKALENFKVNELAKGLEVYAKDAFAIAKGLPWGMYINDPAVWIDHEKLQARGRRPTKEELEMEEYRKTDPMYQRARRLKAEREKEGKQT